MNLTRGTAKFQCETMKFMYYLLDSHIKETNQTVDYMDELRQALNHENYRITQEVGRLDSDILVTRTAVNYILQMNGQNHPFQY
jgi:hypothetical protein